MKYYILCIITLSCSILHAQGPEVTVWILNSTNETGYNGIPSNVQQVEYSDENVYVSCSSIPGYDIGPWIGNPNIPVDQDFTFKITRNPEENTGVLTNTPLGHIGIWRNGVSIFNSRDAMSYNNQGIWHQDALPNEGASFDDCLGHPAPGGEYHNHVNPTCLYDDDNSTVHAPLIGFAFDGFPIYGAYGYSNTDGTGGIVRMETSYRLRDITERTTLADGTLLTAGQYGPAINATYPLGKYLEDYEYIEGLGHLDAHNGRWCHTPEYPDGIYAYFVTVDESLEPVYPYTLGPTYYGIVQPGNTGLNSGDNTPPADEEVISWNPTSVADIPQSADFTAGPNPAYDYITVKSDEIIDSVSFSDAAGRILLTENWRSVSGRLALSHLPAGIYSLVIRSGSSVRSKKIMVR